jgi:hypothetical protein
MRERRSSIPLRRPVFVGCEGESESGYAGLLQDMIRAANVSVHLLIADLGIGAGDPFSRVAMAVRKLEQLRRTRTAPFDRFVLLDSDQADSDRDRAIAARSLALQNGIQIVWQRPCFEAVILRHLPRCATRRPPDSAEAKRALHREWTDYEKPMARAELARKIGLAAILQAADVEPELNTMLRCIGLLRID